VLIPVHRSIDIPHSRLRQNILPDAFTGIKADLRAWSFDRDGHLFRLVAEAYPKSSLTGCESVQSNFCDPRESCAPVFVVKTEGNERKHRTEDTEVPTIREPNSNVSADRPERSASTGANPHHGPGFRPTVVANFC
jgi:hypothetical protein